MEKEENKIQEKKENEKEDGKNKFNFVKTISCPNCPINCFSISGAMRHAEECNGKREQGICCLCKKPNTPDYYDPEKKRYWFLCWKCYNWAKNKSICL